MSMLQSVFSQSQSVKAILTNCRQISIALPWRISFHVSVHYDPINMSSKIWNTEHWGGRKNTWRDSEKFVSCFIGKAWKNIHFANSVIRKRVLCHGALWPLYALCSHSSLSLLFPDPFALAFFSPFLNGFPRDSAILAVGPSQALQWGRWSWLKPVGASIRQAWPLLTEAAPQPPATNTMTPASSKYWNFHPVLTHSKINK